MPKSDEQKREFLMHGDRPQHEHVCRICNNRWKCDSPYCDFMTTICVPCGGIEPIIQGREPWRGGR